MRKASGSLTAILALGAFALAGASGTHAASAASDQVERQAAFARELDQFIGRLRASPLAVPGTVVVAVHGDRTVFEKAYGVRHLATGAPMTLDTPVYNASVTKAYTGLLAAILDADGKLPLSATLKDVWPGMTLPPPLDPSTVRISELLSHSGGIRAGGLNFRSVWTGQVEMSDVRAHLAKFATPTQPGFVYDNLGPFVWSSMAHSRTGVEWRDLLRQRVLTPLGLKRTSARLEDFAKNEVARCHPRVGGRWGPGVLKQTPVLNAAGGMYASGRDEATFLKAFLTDGKSANGRIPAAILRRTWQKESDQDQAMWGLHRDGHGLGWDLGTIAGYRFVSRSGGYPGCRAISMFFPEHGLGVVVMSNGDAAANTYHATILAQAIESWANPAKAEAQAPTRITAIHKVMAEAAAEADKVDPRLAQVKAIDPQVRAAMTGNYRNERLGDLKIVEQGSELAIIGGEMSIPLRYLGDNAFVAISDFGASIERFEVIRDPSGRVTGVMRTDDRYERVGGTH